ncbi:MAG: hypothetical protein GY870_21510 [archaeon]|nr:hypothetical protein [archaeon]
MKLLVSMILVVAAVALTSGSVFATDRCNFDNAVSYGTNPDTGTAVWKCKFDESVPGWGTKSWYYFCSYCNRSTIFQKKSRKKGNTFPS